MHTRLSNIWTDIDHGELRRQKVYVVQTATKVIERCLLMTTDPGDLVLDPTCGSGTTAFVAEKWGRRWITCDTSRVAITLAKQRLMTASFDYYALRYPHEGLKGGFVYQTVPHVTLKSIANNPDIDTIWEERHPAIATALDALNAALLAAPPAPFTPGAGLSQGQARDLRQGRAAGGMGGAVRPARGLARRRGRAVRGVPRRAPGDAGGDGRVDQGPCRVRDALRQARDRQDPPAHHRPVLGRGGAGADGAEPRRGRAAGGGRRLGRPLGRDLAADALARRADEDRHPRQGRRDAEARRARGDPGLPASARLGHRSTPASGRWSASAPSTRRWSRSRSSAPSRRRRRWCRGRSS